MPSLVSTVVVPLACGALGGAVAFGLFAPKASQAPDTSCTELAAQVKALEASVKALETSVKEVARAPVAVAGAEAAPMQAETKAIAESLLAEARQRRDELLAQRDAQDLLKAQLGEAKAAQAERNKANAEVELVRMRNLQSSTTVEQSQENVTRRLKRLGLPDTELPRLAELGAPYLRQRTDVVIRLLEKAAAGTPLAPSEVDQQLKPLDEALARALPTTLDELTRRAVANELGGMVRLPFVLRHGPP
jgi:multidrug efflux pump subunit AcrA (membrane-fusion protein)